jgi:hypothetical protein
MTPENFCYWLQGFFELENPAALSVQQVQQIKDHLQLVFRKETPTYISVDEEIRKMKAAKTSYWPVEKPELEEVFCSPASTISNSASDKIKYALLSDSKDLRLDILGPEEVKFVEYIHPCISC